MSNRKLAKFLIVLDNESLLYFPGSFLTGQVIVELDDDTAVQGKYLLHAFYQSERLVKSWRLSTMK
ncbi:arrestin domain-containing protein 1-like [Tropilaelaps mercedesae]|uniref:Arrestin domain-containing protein 1-like n=1 Tax=Tropilaelaps mercedesae TaxID=418985 RepID=A0A1V9XS61_9ACAR|nr:arrestin domain-containing protein 1-like [Tropilaelaps mercedesae]